MMADRTQYDTRDRSLRSFLQNSWRTFLIRIFLSRSKLNEVPKKAASDQRSRAQTVPSFGLVQNSRYIFREGWVSKAADQN